MNKLAVLAFALLLFFSTMLWYLANGSLNDYLRSQVILQSQYYTGYQAQLAEANFSVEKGTATFSELSIFNHEKSPIELFMKIDSIMAILATQPIKQLNSASVQNKTTTLIKISELRFNHVAIRLDKVNADVSNIDEILKTTLKKLATDYPALYPEISAQMYAEKFPDRNESVVLSNQQHEHAVNHLKETPAVIASKQAKQQKRLLGKATTRVLIENIFIDQLSINLPNERNPLLFKNISLKAIDEQNGIASNQVGGELLRTILIKAKSLI